jgi:endonuclease/exonuclease/phosphatase family metal-dependent hydrolase
MKVTAGIILLLLMFGNVFGQTITANESTYEAGESMTVTFTGEASVSNLKVMQFNVWSEGTSVPNGLTYIRDIIHSVNPDLVCFSEVKNYSGDWTTKIINELVAIGTTYHRGYVAGADVSIISKYPITSSGPVIEGATAVFVVNINGASIVVCPSHLDYTYYATYLPRGYACGGSGKYAGWNALSPFLPETNISEISAQNQASKRDEQIGAFIDYMKNEKRPILLIGDFNEPSCLDWTVGQANLYDHNGVVYEWPTTLTLKNNGFIDAYRQVYPDEVLNPGITWPAIATGVGSTSWAPLSDERDRIDYIFYKGMGVVATKASIVGPKDSYAKNTITTSGNGDDVFEASSMPWPSDHKAVTATLNFSFFTNGTNFVNDSSKDILVFPNPTSGQFSLISSESKNVKVSITKTSGGEVFSKRMDLLADQYSLLNISEIPSGAYLLNVISKKNSQVIKLIKQ